MDSADTYKWRLHKLRLFANKLEAGQFVQVTGLNPILGLLVTPAHVLRYVLYLLTLTKRQLRPPINPVTVMPQLVKVQCIEELVSIIEAGCIESEHYINSKRAYLERYSGGCKRVSVHATRIKWADADAGLIYELFDSLDSWLGTPRLYSSTGRYQALSATRYFCCDYKNYRFQLTPDYTSRVRQLIAYFEQAMEPQISQ